MSDQQNELHENDEHTSLDELNDQGAGAGVSDEPTTFEPEEEDA